MNEVGEELFALQCGTANASNQTMYKPAKPPSNLLQHTLKVSQRKKS